MTEHQHMGPSTLNKIEAEKKTGENAGAQIAGAIVLGSIILTVGIFYNTRLVLKKMDSQNSQDALKNAAAAAQLQAAGAQPQNQQAQQPAAPIDYKAREDEPVLGKKDAPVTMVEFADFQCPYCKQFHDQNFAEIKSKYIDTGKVKLVFRHFPLPFHVNAQIAGQAAECANRQGKFWQYYEVLFDKGSGDGTGLTAADLKSYADSLGLNKGTLGFNKNEFNKCLDSNATQDVVKNDETYGTSVGVSGTPTFYLNGKQIVGAQPLASFEQAIETALGK